MSWTITKRIDAGLALAAAVLSVSACTTLPSWRANTISLGAAFGGVLTREDGCVLLISDNRRIMPIWPRPTRLTADGILTPSGTLLRFGEEVAVAGGFGRQDGRWDALAKRCNASAFSVNHDGAPYQP